MKIIGVDVTLEPEDYGFKFTVKRPDGKAAVGAAITCGTLTGTTDSDGVATIGPFEAGTYDYSVTVTGFKVKTGSVTAV